MIRSVVRGNRGDEFALPKGENLSLKFPSSMTNSNRTVGNFIRTPEKSVAVAGLEPVRF
uniref:Uncharacterized protein n=1 Tax=uncultured Bacillota bacterium TaxID=344338 RepID=A0A650F4T2_9FIRM|nr:hypothetical protein Firmicute1046_2210 [uncultured Firmicutes bacterium]